MAGEWLARVAAASHVAGPSTISFLYINTIHLDLIPLVNMSYADAASKGPKQTPEEAAAAPVPEVVHTESASTSSLIDVDMPSVHTVNSEFLDQDVQTETQAKRLEREADAAKAKAEKAASKASGKVSDKAKRVAGKAREADSWLTAQFSKLTDKEAGGLAISNLVALVGVSSALGYKAWGLYSEGRLSWQYVGAGVGILAAVGAAESFVGTYLYKGKGKGKKDN